MKIDEILSILDTQLISGQTKFTQPVQESFIEQSVLAVKGVARQPDVLFFGQTDFTGMIQLTTQHLLVDFVRDTHTFGSIKD